MTKEDQESKRLINAFPISTTTDMNPPPSTINPFTTSKLVRIQAQFGLEGLTCSSCSNSVLEAVRQLANELSSEEDSTMTNHVIDPNSIRVALFPDSKLDVILSCSSERINDIVTKIMDCIEDIGFEAELWSKKELKYNDEEKMNGEDDIRTVLIQVERNAKGLFQFYSNLLNKTHLIETLQWHSDKMVDKGECDTLEVSYRPSVSGIRDIIDKGKHSKEIQEIGGCGKIEVTDANSYHLMMEKTEQRQRLEIEHWRNGELEWLLHMLISNLFLFVSFFSCFHKMKPTHFPIHNVDRFSLFCIMCYTCRHYFHDIHTHSWN